MERRRSFLGWMAIGLGVLVLLGVVGGIHAQHSFGVQRSAVVHDDQRGMMPDQGGWGMHKRDMMRGDPHGMMQDGPHGMMQDGPHGMMQDGPHGMMQDGPRGAWQDERGNRSFQAVPAVPAQPPLPPHVVHFRDHRGPGSHFGGFFFLPLMLLGSILRFALFAAVAYAVVRWLQRREARRNQDPPTQPPHTGDTQSL